MPNMFVSSFQSSWYVWLKLSFTTKLVDSFLNEALHFFLDISGSTQLCTSTTLTVRGPRAPTAPISLPSPGPHLSCPVPSVPAPAMLQQGQSPGPHVPAYPWPWATSQRSLGLSSLSPAPDVPWPVLLPGWDGVMGHAEPHGEPPLLLELLALAVPL